jgi:hypothetical protein
MLSVSLGLERRVAHIFELSCCTLAQAFALFLVHTQRTFAVCIGWFDWFCFECGILSYIYVMRD